MDKHNLFTSNFKENIIFIIKLFIMLALVIAFLLVLSPQYLQKYTASLIDKVNRLESIDEPKIVLISDSNLAFGINSEEIEEAFGMPVVNMGLHGGLGNAFHERMALLNVRKGDIYILCHTIYSDDGNIPECELAWITIEDHFELWKLLRSVDIKPMFEAYPVYLKKCISLWINECGNEDIGGVYSRRAFNDYGDIEWESEYLEYDFKEGEIFALGVTDNVAKRINELNHKITQKGATLLLAGYPIADVQDRPSDEVYSALGVELDAEMDAPVISDYKDYIYPTDYFFDATFHLNNTGKQVRTKQLIDDLQNYFNSMREDEYTESE